MVVAKYQKNRFTSTSDFIDRVELLNPRHLFLHGYIFPFFFLYLLWAYFWVVVYGIANYFELGLIILAAIGCVQILVCLFCHWSIHIKAFLTCSKSFDPFTTKIVKVVPTANNGYPELVVLNKETVNNGTVLSFTFQKSKYNFDLEEKNQVVAVDFPVDNSFKYFNDWRGYENDTLFQSAKSKYGFNDMTMDIPKFADLFRERATAPFFVFQVFCVGLWCLDEYWYYSVFTLFMLVVFECTLVQQQLRNMAEIRKMGVKPYPINVYRNKKWFLVMSNELVSGDLISVVRSTDERLIPCDLLLVRGTCIVDESMLTGESVPVMKEAIENSSEPEHHFHLESDSKLHVLFGGTKVVQHSPPQKSGPGLKAPDNGCVAYVIRTGFNTSQGKLLKTILFGVKQVTANNLETFLFILFLLVFALIASGYLWIEGTKDPKRNKYKLFLECTLIITSVVPPELPIELSLAVNSSLIALTKLYIFCTEPFRIPFAGKLDICCFDKTGTLTRDEMVVDGVTGLSTKCKEDELELTAVIDSPITTQQVLACCHSLVLLERDSELVGDPLEKAILKSVEWTLTRGEAVIPRRSSGLHPLKIFQRYHFSSALQRMSVVSGYTRAGSVDTEYIVAVKGAPETLKRMFTSVPDTYDQHYLTLARRGARVLALGHRVLGALSHQQVRDLKRENIEKDLEFAGFVSISCPLKQDSKTVIKEIQRSSHHVTMITGDNPLTACHVGKKLKMLRKPSTLILAHEIGIESEIVWIWKATDESESIPLDTEANAKSIRAFAAKYDLCLTGEAIAYLQANNKKFVDKLLPVVGIFARVTPKQKEHIVTSLKRNGFSTLMCGDGTNDVGALKHAHIGVALLANAPESLTPVSSNSTNTATSNNMGNGPTENAGDHPSQANQVQQPHSRRPGRGRGRPQGPQPGANPQQDINRRLSSMMQEMEAEEKAQVVRLGDASIAAPFTSKLSSVQGVCHIIKQGRCTLVTTLQMFKILALNALILAYSQSVLYLDGVKFSDGQATFQGLLLAGCFLFISRSKPLKTLSRRRPLPNIFNIYTLLTVLLQFGVHFSSLVYLTREAKARGPQRAEGEFPDLEAEFKPDLLNTVVYLISMSMQLSTFAVNYKGHPFMESLTENKPLLYSLLGAGLAVSSLCAGIIPEFSTQFAIVDIPNEFRLTIMKVMAGDMMVCFLLDRFCDWLFGKGHLKRLV